MVGNQWISIGRLKYSQGEREVGVNRMGRRLRMNWSSKIVFCVPERVVRAAFAYRSTSFPAIRRWNTFFKAIKKRRLRREFSRELVVSKSSARRSCSGSPPLTSQHFSNCDQEWAQVNISTANFLCSFLLSDFIGVLCKQPPLGESVHRHMRNPLWQKCDLLNSPFFVWLRNKCFNTRRPLTWNGDGLNVCVCVQSHYVIQTVSWL